MKKIFILIILFAVANIYKSNAQRFYFGVNGGFLKNATIVDDYGPFSDLQSTWNKKRLNSLTWGINLGYQLSKHWSIETQLQFIDLGYYERLSYLYHPTNTPGGWLPVEIDWYNHHDYLRIPILANYNFLSNNSKFGISLLAGLSFGLQTNQATKFIGLDELSQKLADRLDDQEMPLNKLDLGLQVGLRLKTRLYKSFSIFVEENFYEGSSSIINYPEQASNRRTESYEYLDFVNRHLTTNIGLLYNF